MGSKPFLPYTCKYKVPILFPPSCFQEHFTPPLLKCPHASKRTPMPYAVAFSRRYTFPQRTTEPPLPTFPFRSSLPSPLSSKVKFRGITFHSPLLTRDLFNDTHPSLIPLSHSSPPALNENESRRQRAAATRRRTFFSEVLRGERGEPV